MEVKNFLYQEWSNYTESKVFKLLVKKHLLDEP